MNTYSAAHQSHAFTPPGVLLSITDRWGRSATGTSGAGQLPERISSARSRASPCLRPVMLSCCEHTADGGLADPRAIAVRSSLRAVLEVFLA